MLKSPLSRLAVDEITSNTFPESLARFGAGLTPPEWAILSALLRTAMDPWSRSILDPPELTAEEIATLDRLASRS
jgi:hypothetical protein